MKSNSLILAALLTLTLTASARADVGLIDRRFTHPEAARFEAATTDDGRLVVRSASQDEAVSQARDERRLLEARDGWRDEIALRSSLVAALESLAPRAIRDDGFDAVFTYRLGAIKLFLDAPPSIVGDDTKELGKRIESNPIDDYFLNDDMVTVGVHASSGRLFVEAFYSANVIGIFGVDRFHKDVDRLVLERREPNRGAIRAAWSLAPERALEVFGEVAAESSLEGGRVGPGFRVGLRGSF